MWKNFKVLLQAIAMVVVVWGIALAIPILAVVAAIGFSVCIVYVALTSDDDDKET
jgi:Na+/H+ antiporter NhaB